MNKVVQEQTQNLVFIALNLYIALDSISPLYIKYIVIEYIIHMVFMRIICSKGYKLPRIVSGYLRIALYIGIIIFNYVNTISNNV